MNEYDVDIRANVGTIDLTQPIPADGSVYRCGHVAGKEVQTIRSSISGCQALLLAVRTRKLALSLEVYLGTEKHQAHHVGPTVRYLGPRTGKAHKTFYGDRCIEIYLKIPG